MVAAALVGAAAAVVVAEVPKPGKAVVGADVCSDPKPPNVAVAPVVAVVPPVPPTPKPVGALPVTVAVAPMLPKLGRD